MTVTMLLRGPSFGIRILLLRQRNRFPFPRNRTQNHCRKRKGRPRNSAIGCPGSSPGIGTRQPVQRAAEIYAHAMVNGSGLDDHVAPPSVERYTLAELVPRPNIASAERCPIELFQPASLANLKRRPSQTSRPHAAPPSVVFRTVHFPPNRKSPTARTRRLLASNIV